VKAAGCQSISIISGVGVRPYYRRLGYKLQNTYMVKTLRRQPAPILQNFKTIKKS